MLDLFSHAETAQAVNDNCLGCGKSHPGERQVVLADGRRVSNYSEAWRAECEASAILALGSLVERQAHLARIGKFRGASAADQVRDAMLSVWNARQAQRLAQAKDAA